MRRLFPALAALALLVPTSANTLPSFPVEVTGGECLGSLDLATCTPHALTWTLFAGGNFADSEAGVGTWQVNPATGMATLYYLGLDSNGDGIPDFPWPYTYVGTIAGNCATGQIYNNGTGLPESLWQGCI